MRTSTSLTFILLLVLAVPAVGETADDGAIVAVVEEAYVHGIHIERDTDKVRKGFHESFVMFVKNDKGEVSHLSRDAWIERIEAAKAKGDQSPRPTMTAKIAVLDRAGSAAVVKVDLFRDGKQVFTDYIALYRFDDGWKLVGKTFERH